MNCAYLNISRVSSPSVLQAGMGPAAARVSAAARGLLSAGSGLQHSQLPGNHTCGVYVQKQDRTPPVDWGDINKHCVPFVMTTPLFMLCCGALWCIVLWCARLRQPHSAALIRRDAGKKRRASLQESMYAAHCDVLMCCAVTRCAVGSCSSNALFSLTGAPCKPPAGLCVCCLPHVDAARCGHFNLCRYASLF